MAGELAHADEFERGVHERRQPVIKREAKRVVEWHLAERALRAEHDRLVRLEPLGQAGEPWQVEVPLNKFKSKFDGMSTHIPGLPIGMELTDIWVFSPEESAELEIHRVEFLPSEVGQ